MNIGIVMDGIFICRGMAEDTRREVMDLDEYVSEDRDVAKHMDNARIHLSLAIADLKAAYECTASKIKGESA